MERGPGAVAGCGRTMTFDLRFVPRIWPEIAEAIAWHERVPS